MPQYRLSPQAEQDIEAILEWTHETFGEKARLRYQALLTLAIKEYRAQGPDEGGTGGR
jgi:toxin ParE1/3/4